MSARARPQALTPDLVLFGNLLVDDVVFRDGCTRMGEAGGAMLYAALGASLWGIRIGITSVVGTDYPADALAALEVRGVDLSGLRRLRGPGLRTWLLYEEHSRRVIHQLGRPSHLKVSPRCEDIPAAYQPARAFHVAPMPLERQRELVEHLTGQGDAIVSLDPYEPVREDNLASWLEILERVDVFFPSEDELGLEGAETDPRAALARLCGRRLQFVAFKRGARGGLLYEPRRNHIFEWTATGPPVVDCTGAGDAFAGGFLAGLLASGSAETGIQQGVVSASAAIENWGARGLLATSLAQAERRRQAWFGAKAGS